MDGSLDLRHCSSDLLISTTYQKAVLRVAAETFANFCAMDYYFPSFEIITGSHNSSRYYGPDLRFVTQEGAGHFMAIFMRHLTEGDKKN